jgi:hypothetical protein
VLNRLLFPYRPHLSTTRPLTLHHTQAYKKTMMRQGPFHATNTLVVEIPMRAPGCSFSLFTAAVLDLSKIA